MIGSKCERSSRIVAVGTGCGEGWGEEELLGYSFLTLAINSNGWSWEQLGCCGRFTSKYKYGGEKMSCPHRGSDPNCPARSLSLHRLR